MWHLVGKSINFIEQYKLVICSSIIYLFFLIALTTKVHHLIHKLLNALHFIRTLCVNVYGYPFMSTYRCILVYLLGDIQCFITFRKSTGLYVILLWFMAYSFIEYNILYAYRIYLFHSYPQINSEQLDDFRLYTIDSLSSSIIEHIEILAFLLAEVYSIIGSDQYNSNIANMFIVCTTMLISFVTFVVRGKRRQEIQIRHALHID